MVVEPIKNMNDVNSIHRLLTKWGRIREAECWLIGCNLALRVSDLLQIRFSDMESQKYLLKEKKTQKHKQLRFNQTVIDCCGVLEQYYQSKDQAPVYLFQATGNRVGSMIKPISSKWLLRLLKDAGETLGLTENIGTHTMRKTFAYHAYKNGAPVENIQKLLNHDSPKTTLSYIGITQETVNEMYDRYEIAIVR